jgi:hypothetical protein
LTAILPPNHPFSSRIYLARKNCPGSYKGSQNLGLSPHTQEISVSVQKSSDQVLGNHQTWQMNSIGQPQCPQKAPKRASKKGPNLDIRQLERLLTCIVWQLCARSQIGLHVFPRCCPCFANRRVPEMPHQIIPTSYSITSGAYPRILQHFLSIYVINLSYSASYSRACQLRGPIHNMAWTIIYYRLARQKRRFLPPCQFTNPWVICVFDRLYLHYECTCVGEA